MEPFFVAIAKERCYICCMEKTEFIRKCKCCGKEFTTTRANKFTCCRACAYKACPSKQPKNALKVCIICGKTYSSRGNTKTCSPECSYINKMEWNRQDYNNKKEEYKQKRMKYRLEHKEEISLKRKEYNASHKEKNRQYQNKYYYTHREELLLKGKERMITKKEEICEMRKEAYKKRAGKKRRVKANIRQDVLKSRSSVLNRPITNTQNMIDDSVWTACNLERIGLGRFRCLRCKKEFLEDYTHLNHFIEKARMRNVCPYCSDYPYGSSRVSTPEIEIQKLFPEFSVAHWRPEWLGGRELDLYAPEYNLALEYDGVKWHSGVTKADRRKYAVKHIEKTDLCEKHGIQLIHLFETEWLNSRECVIDKLSAIFHRPMERYMARKCYTQVVESGTTEFNKCRDEVVAFLNRNHIQGAGTSGSCRVMLRDKATGELRAVCCFQNRHGRSKATEEEWDLCRYATALGTTVAGGITKCISAFKGAHPECKVLTSLADRRWTSTLRSAYSSSGFEWDGGPAHADYFYVVKRDGRPRLVNKSNYQLKFIDREFPETFIEGADNTEWARMERAGVPYIYDCGKLKYVMKLD